MKKKEKPSKIESFKGEVIHYTENPYADIINKQKQCIFKKKKPRKKT